MGLGRRYDSGAFLFSFIADQNETMTPIGPSLCPVCGVSNQCAAEQGEVTCWCHSIEVDPRLIEDLPPELQDVSCLCSFCASKKKITPCTGVCEMDADGKLCIGCDRTQEEPSGWKTMATDDKIKIMHRVRSSG